MPKYSLKTLGPHVVQMVAPSNVSKIIVLNILVD